MKMFCLVIVFLIFLPAASLDVHAQQTEIGIKGGLSPYTLNFSNNSEKNGRSRTHLGFFTQIQLDRSARYFLQPEIIYSLQGAELTADNRLITLDYLNIPVLFQYSPAKFKGLRLQAGPQFGFLMTARSDQNGAAVDLKKRLRSMDFGISTGVNYLHRPTRLGFDIRYNIGLRSISDNGSLRSKNRGLQIGLFYLFNFSNQH